MSNHLTQKAINLFHKQKADGKVRKVERAEHRLYTFQMNRQGIKFKIETDREHLALCGLVFLLGLILVVSMLFYAAGVILYG